VSWVVQDALGASPKRLDIRRERSHPAMLFRGCGFFTKTWARTVSSFESHFERPKTVLPPQFVQ
jgi:hypothetical protein